MNRTAMEYDRHFPEVMKAMTGRGLLLGAYDAEGKPNLMTIGWGTVGSIWGEPVWIVLVRPSRYTYGCMEASGEFSVCVPGSDLAGACALCGAKSGRDLDKFAETGLTHVRGQAVRAPIADECPIVYECRTVQSNDLIPERLDEGIRSRAYAKGDFHRVYYGLIVGAWADAEGVADL